VLKRKIISRLESSKLGRCKKCVGLSILGLGTSLLSYYALQTFGILNVPRVVWLIYAPLILFALLTGAHTVAFALRRIIAGIPRPKESECCGDRTKTYYNTDRERRLFVKFILVSVGVGLLALSRFFPSSFAEGSKDEKPAEAGLHPTPNGEIRASDDFIREDRRKNDLIEKTFVEYRSRKIDGKIAGVVYGIQGYRTGRFYSTAPLYRKQ